jgi:hypothetical protein
MGTMPASDAAPLPRAGEVFFDVRGDSRTMRVSWYGDTGVAVFSIWNGGTCTGTFRLPIPELPRMIDALSHGPGDAGAPPAAHASQQAPAGAADPGPPTAAMQSGDAEDYQDEPGYQDDPGYQDAAGYGPGALGYQEAPQGYPDGPQGYPDEEEPGFAYGPRRYAMGRHGYDEAPGGEYEPLASEYEAPGGGYRDAEPAAGYPPPDAGRPYRQAPADPRQEPTAAGYADWAQLPQARSGQRAAGGPLPVGQWQHDEQAAGPYAGDHGPASYRDDQGQAPYRDDQGQAPYRDDQGPAQYRGVHGPAPYADDHGPAHDHWPDQYRGDHGPAPYPGDHGPADGYDPEGEPPYPGPGIDELGADPLEADYGGEAEQGFLPGPPTETFSPVAVGGSHSRQAGNPAGPGQPRRRGGGYRPAAEDPDDAGGHPGYTRPPDSASESLAYHPGRAGRREREYRPPRDGY